MHSELLTHKKARVTWPTSGRSGRADGKTLGSSHREDRPVGLAGSRDLKWFVPIQGSAVADFKVVKLYYCIVVNHLPNGTFYEERMRYKEVVD